MGKKIEVSITIKPKKLMIFAVKISNKDMNYKETIEYLYNVTPLFQNIGKDAYKEGLDNTIKLDNYFNHPHKNFKTIHIAGTNGKGSCSHTIAAILQSAGYKTGLYTSPHLVDFSERIRVNGEPIEEEFVIAKGSRCSRYRSRFRRTPRLYKHHYSGSEYNYKH